MADTPASPDPSDNEDEELMLTPGQHPNSDPAGSPRVNPAHTQPPPTDTHPPLFKKPKLDDAYIKARLNAYEQPKQRKDFKGKNKSFSTSAPKGGNSKPVHQPAPYPPSYNQFNHGYSAPAPQHPYYSDTAPPPPRHWGSGGPYGGSQGHPSYSYPYSGYSQDMPQHSSYPPWSHSQWMPHQGYGSAPPMDRNWHYTHPQQG